MSQPSLYIAITNHGFGHTTRSSALVDHLQQQCPDLKVIVASTAPQWLINSYIRSDYIYRPQAFDIGVIQSDSVTMDKEATLEKLQQIQKHQDELICDEAEFLKQHNVGLVIGDIPPLATKIAHAAGVPCWMASNFGWDFIYRDWGNDLNGAFVEITEWIADCFSECDRLFRLPFYEAMSAFPTVEDVGLTAGSPRYDNDELRQIFDITAPKEKTVLLTFGGLGLAEVPYEALRARTDWQFITFDHQPPSDFPNLLKVTDRTYRPVDFMPLCGQIVSKPGYSTFAEACRVEVPVTSVERRDFAEAPVLVKGLKEHAHHKLLTIEELYAGDWAFLDTPFNPPQTQQKFRKDGNETIVQAILQHFERF
ncbi:MAG: glycosyl transferase [Cyanobacteria bacterium P01_F01_bin.150]